ncbi:MAG: biopolymer transporter ExbD [Cyanobacteria bacterium CRU_2_1]|nr:biopolymer transporter ExbD [Cyanobacteria bacterium RU_5_0]NJR57649.1 biopolymer transporter ExbD [Cyanobacteria bacterium CRU_2_1]
MKIDFDNGSEQEVRIEIVPLIDVIFCILTFFILAAVTLTRQTAINVDLPRASTGTTQLRELLIVSVDPIGQTYIENQPVGRDQLYQQLVEFRRISPEGTIALYASPAASYNDVIQVLDLLKQAGGNRIALATRPQTDGSDGEPIPNLSPGVEGQSPFPGLDQYELEPIPGLEELPGSSFSPSAPPSSVAPNAQPDPSFGVDPASSDSDFGKPVP